MFVYPMATTHPNRASRRRPGFPQHGLKNTISGSEELLHEENRSHYPAPQARRRQGSFEGDRNRWHDHYGSARPRPAKGPQRGLPGYGISGGSAAQNEDRDGGNGRAAGRGGAHAGLFGAHGQDWGR